MSFKQRVMRNPFFWAALAGVVAIPLLRPMFRHEPAPPPVLWRIPSFSLTNQRGESFGSAELRGTVYVVGFFFTTCKDICPKLTRAVKRLHDRYIQWKSKVHIVFITIDPRNDTPAVLDAYAKKHGIDPSRWTFLTGDEKTIRRLIEGGFKSHVGARETRGGVLDISHTGNLALVDSTGQLRGTYRSDNEGLDEAFHRSQHVWLEGRRSGKTPAQR